jgi:tripartite-type tricarboxylate transporter receptor subunit TctC
MTQQMSEILGQQVVVENVGGAGGMIGSKRVADAAPDGYIFLLETVGTHVQGQSLFKKPHRRSHSGCAHRRSPNRAHCTQGSAGTGEQSFGIHFLRQSESEQNVIRLCRRGLGNSSRLRTAQLSRRAYRGTGPAMQDLQGGQIDYLCEIISTAKSHRWQYRETHRHHDQASDRKRCLTQPHAQGALKGRAYK